MKPLAILQHEPDDPPGSIAVALTRSRRAVRGAPPRPGRRAARVAARDRGPHRPGRLHARDADQGAPVPRREIKLMRRIVHEGGPVWGICLGAQLLALAAGGDVYKRKHARGRLGEHREGRRRPAAARHLVAVRRLQLARVLVQAAATSHLVARCGDGVQVFRAGGKAWGTQFHPEVDAEMAPHWVRDAVKEHEAPRRGVRASSCAPRPTSACPATRRSAAAHRELRRSAPGSCPASPLARSRPARSGPVRTKATLSRRLVHPFPGSPSGRGACERSHGVVPGGTSAEEGCVEGDSTAQTVYYHRHNS